MTKRVNGGVVPGNWSERKIDYIKLEFASQPTSRDDGFYDPDTVLYNAIALLSELKATPLAVGKMFEDTVLGTWTVDVILGANQGWTSDDTGLIYTATDLEGKVWSDDPAYEEDYGDTGTTETITVEFKYAKLAGLELAEMADLVEFPEGSDEWWTIDRFDPHNDD